MSKSPPRLFVASSVAGLDLARAIHSNLEHDAEVTTWSEGFFTLSKSTIARLIEESKNTDFAAFVLHPEDQANIKGEDALTVRDNVIFEWGLFIGALGVERCFAVLPRGVKLHLPSDVIGITPATYKHDRSDHNHEAALTTACNEIRKVIRRLGPLRGYAENLSLDERALATPAVQKVLNASPEHPPSSTDVLSAIQALGALAAPAAKLGRDGLRSVSDILGAPTTAATTTATAERLRAMPEVQEMLREHGIKPRGQPNGPEARDILAASRLKFLPPGTTSTPAQRSACRESLIKIWNNVQTGDATYCKVKTREAARAAARHLFDLGDAMSASPRPTIAEIDFWLGRMDEAGVYVDAAVERLA